MPLTPPKQENVKLACEIAWKTLQSSDLGLVCERTGAAPAGEGALTVRFLNETYRVDRAGQSITGPGGETVTGRMVALILHYLTQGDGMALTGKEIGFPQVPGAGFYEGPFRGRIVSRIVRRFGADPSLLLKCGMDLGGRKASYGDAAMTFDLFPYVPATLIVWRGDEEFSANANVVFDACIGNYLTVEDVVIGCEELVNRLSKAASAVSGETRK